MHTSNLDDPMTIQVEDSFICTGEDAGGCFQYLSAQLQHSVLFLSFSNEIKCYFPAVHHWSVWDSIRHIFQECMC